MKENSISSILKIFTFPQHDTARCNAGSENYTSFFWKDLSDIMSKFKSVIHIYKTWANKTNKYSRGAVSFSGRLMIYDQVYKCVQFWILNSFKIRWLWKNKTAVMSWSIIKIYSGILKCEYNRIQRVTILKGFLSNLPFAQQNQWKYFGVP